MRTGALPLALLVVAATSCDPPPTATTADATVLDSCRGAEPDDPRLAELIQRTRDHLADANVPGAAIAIVRDGGVDTLATGSKLPTACDPITEDSRFYTLFGRHLTGATVLAAAAAGEVALDAPITDYLPTFGVATPADAADLTLAHLLTHTSGYSMSHLNDCRDIDQLLALYQQVPLWAPPGSVHLMLPFEYGLAGNALGDYRAAVHRHVIDPLGLTGSFDRIEVIKGDIAVGVRRSGDNLLPVPFSLAECAISEPYLGYFTSARDAGTFLATLLASDSAALVGRADAFYPPERATPGGFVRGPLADGVEWLAAGGHTSGYAYAVRIVPERGFAAAVFVNAGHGDASMIAEQAVRIFTGSERALQVTPQDSSSFGALAGTYRESLGDSEIEVVVDGGSLTARIQGSDALPLSPGTRFGGYVDDVFAVEVGETTHLLRFWRDAEGRGQIISQDTFRDGLGPPFFRVE